MNQLKGILEQLRFSAPLPREVLEQLAAESTVRRVPAGTYLFREGSDNRNLYLIRSGRLALEMNVPGRGEVRILTLGPGEMAGWSALLGDGKMTAGAVAVEDTEVVAAEADKLRQLCQSNRDFGYHLMRRMAAALSQRLLATRLQLLDLFADTPPVMPADRMEQR
jgi:CRP-like cAMP-binding protein